MDVRQLLRLKSSHVVTIAPDASTEAVARILTEQRVGALPVLEGSAVIGLFSERDFVRAIARHGAAALHLPVGQFMVTPAATCTPDSSIQDLMRRMTTMRLRHLPVLDGGRLCGIVSIGDVVKHRLREAEVEAGVLRDYIAVTRTPVLSH